MAREEGRRGFLESTVWTHSTGQHAIGERAFIAAFAFWTLIGLATSALTSYMAIQSKLQLSWPLVIGTLVSALLGIFLTTGCINPLVSIIGYFMIAAPFGLFLGPIVAMYTTASVLKVLLVTLGVTAGAGVVGLVYPGSMRGWLPFLINELLALIVGLIVFPLLGTMGIPVSGALHWMDWIAVVLFSALVAFDMNRAMEVDRTYTNAIDCAVGLYLDILNLFTHLLSLFGVKKSD